MIFLAALVESAVAFTPNDPEFRYTGRWDQSNPAQPWAYAKGTSIIVGFEGSSLSGTFSASSTDYLRIIIDGQPPPFSPEKIQISSGMDTYPLAWGLPDEPHIIEIVKETDAGRWTFHELALEGTGDLFAVPASAEPVRRLVFYGDSNLAGYSLSHEQNNSGQIYRGSHYGYAGIVSRMFGAEYSNISRSGATIRTLHTSYDRIDWWTPSSTWDFDNFRPDAVIINIGANDVGRPKRKIKKDYHALLDDMRVSYPDAHIMLYNSWGWDYDEPANYIHEVIEERVGPNTNMSWATFPWIFEQWHGSEYDHGGMAQILVEHLLTIFPQWAPVADADVMNGYGIGRDVANGAFEEVAPFGGYGWRYWTDDGVIRRTDSDDHGYYLRLEDGAASHQPKPAKAGETVTVTVSMRGSSESDQAYMTIDFRDQEMWTAPLAPTEKTIDLNTGWKENITMSATAPTGTTRPVFHTRLTFRAAPDSTVDIDDVVMSVDEVSDPCTDKDNDGYGNPGDASCANGSASDCNDGNASVNPGAFDFCGNDIDEDCIGGDSECPPCTEIGSCISNSDCCSQSCSKGKPANRVCQ